MERHGFSSAHNSDKIPSNVPYENFFNDIITPLSVMYINIQQLENDGFNLRKETVKHHVENIKNSWFQVMKVINDACDSQKILNGTLQPAFRNHDLVALLKGIAESARLLSKRKNILLSFSCDVTACVASVDKQIFERIVLNMLSYAFKRTSEGGHVFMDVVRERDRLAIMVRDNGRPSPGSLLEQIIPLFHDDFGDISFQSVPKGFMWLYVVRALAVLINATTVYKTAEDGATVTLYVPIHTTCETKDERKYQDIFYNDYIYQIELSKE